ncbi:hypothetical protein CEXT_18011 [Caerostris extrusa]|uniref:Uncharacterized protein n=1 Tax=Caerostris extrusa TaxID=172846 RepID=A0AAV4QFL2_CAEEX|nr:hypothetical protein CEXT_18011 [Caerostris extrusa]
MTTPLMSIPQTVKSLLRIQQMDTPLISKPLMDKSWIDCCIQSSHMGYDLCKFPVAAKRKCISNLISYAVHSRRPKKCIRGRLKMRVTFF